MKLKQSAARSLFCSLVVGLGLAATALQVSALPIDGSIYFGVAATPDNSNFQNTTQIHFDNGFTIGASGLFAGLPSLTQVSLNSLLLEPFEQAIPLWTINTGGKNYTFNLTSLSTLNRTSSQLKMTGTGVLSSGNERVTASWSFGLNSSGQGVSVTYLTDESKSVPDGGNTALLCLLGLVCLVPLQRKQAGFKIVA